MTRQAIDDTQHLLIHWALLTAFGIASCAAVDWYTDKEELRFAQEFMLNCLNERTQVIGGPQWSAVKCFVY